MGAANARKQSRTANRTGIGAFTGSIIEWNDS